MCLPAISFYRAARMAVRRPNRTLVTTEGEQQVLYVNQDGTMSGTGRVATHMMQHEMVSTRAELVHFATYPVCHHV
jgi:hypothetical protein